MNFSVRLNFKLDFSNLLSDIRNNKLEWTKHGHNMPTSVLPDFYDREIKKIFNTETDTKIYIHNLLP